MRYKLPKDMLDICLALVRGHNRKEYLEFLAMQGYRAIVCRGWEAASVEIIVYMEGHCK